MTGTGHGHDHGVSYQLQPLQAGGQPGCKGRGQRSYAPHERRARSIHARVSSKQPCSRGMKTKYCIV